MVYFDYNKFFSSYNYNDFSNSESVSESYKIYSYFIQDNILKYMKNNCIWKLL